MEWYDKGVVNAITEYKSKHALLIVYIADTSEASHETDASWSNKEVTDVIINNGYVALRILYKSIEYEQFSQLCNQLAVATGVQNSKQLKATLLQAYDKLQLEIAGQQPTLLKQGERSNAKQTKHDDCEESKLEKVQELRRRKEGQEKAMWKKELEDKQQKQWLEQRHKEKQEQKRARQEILNKLEQDRRERQSQTKHNRADIPNLHMQETPSPISECRIQVKFPVHEPIVFQLNPNDILATLRLKISQHIDVATKEIFLTQVYPRKELGFEHDQTALSSLGLTPSGVVLARTKDTKHGYNFNNNDRGIFYVLWYILLFVVNLLIALKDSIIGIFSGSSQTSSSEPRNSAPERIKRFKPDDKDDDEINNTYNGNSTQQQ